MADPYRELNEAELRDLTASIREYGVLVPIVLDADGNVIDGHHRQRIALELGITKVPVKKLNVRGEEAMREAHQLNIDRRHLSARERAAAVRQLHPELSNVAIAEIAGVNEKTVRAERARSAQAEGVKAKRQPVIGRDGKTYRTPEQQQQRNARALKMQQQGKKLSEIASHFGITDARTVSRWVATAKKGTGEQTKRTPKPDDATARMEQLKEACMKAAEAMRIAHSLASRVDPELRNAPMVAHGLQRLRAAADHIASVEAHFIGSISEAEAR